MVKERALFIDKLKKELLEKREDISRLIMETAQEDVAPVQVQDSGDEALLLSMDKLKDSLEQNGVNELRLIEEALTKIEAEDFGYCVDCQEPISEKRLSHFPYAARCIVCQEKYEESVK